jgi:hypothetical protein
MNAIFGFAPELLRDIQVDVVTSAANALSVTSDLVPVGRVWYVLSAHLERSATVAGRDVFLSIALQDGATFTGVAYFNLPDSQSRLPFPTDILLNQREGLRGEISGAAPIDGGTFTIRVRYLELRTSGSAQDRLRSLDLSHEEGSFGPFSPSA